MKKQFIIAAPNSNSGKTIITLGLLRLLMQKGIKVQPFKSGPDYIDPKFHELACGKPGVNLDLFMMSKEEIDDSLSTYGENAEVNCIEGVMGLFDGARKAERSTAELAKKINTPVILVIDAKAVAYSVAPLIQGFKNFDPEVNILGVIFNRVGSESHYTFLKEACEDVGVPSFGYLKNLPEIQIPSRHLGLNIQEINQFDTVIDFIASEIDKTVNWKEILALSECKSIKSNFDNSSNSNPSLKIAIAKDEAFNFIYPQNIKALEELGEVSFFSPLKEFKLPEADFIYFPGGYPECFLEELSENKLMLSSIKNYADTGGLIYAECGGMMYLGKTIQDKEGKQFEMTGVFDYATSMSDQKLSLGYRTVEINNTYFKGHEFHYSTISENEVNSLDCKVFTARNNQINTKYYHKKNVLASYIHLYLGSSQKVLRLIEIIKGNDFKKIGE